MPTTGQVIDLQQIQDKHADKPTDELSKNQRIIAKGNMAKALFNSHSNSQQTSVEPLDHNHPKEFKGELHKISEDERDVELG